MWRKSTSTVHNIIVGKLWIDQVRGCSRGGAVWPRDRPLTTPLPYQTGDVEIVNHKTKDRCQLKFLPYSYFSKEVARKVSKATSWSLSGENPGEGRVPTLALPMSPGDRSGE